MEIKMHLIAPPVIASVVDASPGLAFWTLITFSLVAFVLKWKVWGPLMHAIEEREKSIRDALDKAKIEREQAENCSPSRPSPRRMRARKWPRPFARARSK